MNKNLSDHKRRFWILMHPWKTLFLISGLLIFGSIGFIYWLGFELFANQACNNWRQNMSKAEKIAISLEWANSAEIQAFEIPDGDTGKYFVGNGRQIPYPSIEAIIHENPQCCHIYERGSAKTDQPNEYLPDNDEGVVVLHYMGKYRDAQGNSHSAPIISYVDLNACKE